MVPAAMPTTATNATDVARPGLLGAQRARATALSSLTVPRLAISTRGGLDDLDAAVTHECPQAPR